jgi:hypothetical protein
MSFEETIQKWVLLDNQHRLLNNKTKLIRDQKNKMEEGIFQYIETNKLSAATIKISDGKLQFGDIKQTQPLTLKYVEECLGKCIKNHEEIKNIMNCIKDSRNIKYNSDIKRFYSNK